ncbi:MAG: anaerobic sulfatase maturase, partial [Bacteroidaceae bacterium]|nr:anaerobic sulfatase maturase [Bacteroidaceae bacterium]
MNDSTCYPFSRPLYVMAKPAGSHCNLACRYCYYLEKGAYYGHASGQHFMSDATLERYIREYIQAQTSPEVCFTWHGGEP